MSYRSPRVSYCIDGLWQRCLTWQCRPVDKAPQRPRTDSAKKAWSVPRFRRSPGSARPLEQRTLTPLDNGSASPPATHEGRSDQAENRQKGLIRMSAPNTQSRSQTCVQQSVLSIVGRISQ